MYIPPAIVAFTEDYLYLRREVVAGRQRNVKAARNWIKVNGCKTIELAEMQTFEFYIKNKVQMKRLSGYEKDLMKDIHSDDDDDE